MKNWLSIPVMLLLVLAILLSCSPKAGPQQGGTPEKSISGTTGVQTKQGWEKEWDETVAAAKKEGKVVVLFTGGAEIRSAMADGFYNKYGVVMDAVSGGGVEVAERIAREERAGLYLTDIYQGGVTTPTIILKPRGLLGKLDENFILPDLKDPDTIKKTWRGGELPWVDDDHTIFAFMAYPQAWAVINSNMVKPEELKSFRDLLNPKWKGKIAIFDPTTTGAGGKLLSAVALQIINMDYWREFAKQEPFITRDNRMLVEWVVHGKYPIAIAARPEEINRWQKEGAPLKHLMPEEGIGLTTGSGGLAIMRKPAHPNAAKLFINWLLSKEGITAWSKAGDVQSAREDVPIDFISVEKVRRPDVKYFYLEKEQFLTQESTIYAQAREIFGIR